MKKTLALILALVMVAAILAGCSAKTAPAETTTASDTTATTETPAASTDSSATYTLKLGHDHTTTSPFQTLRSRTKSRRRAMAVSPLKFIRRSRLAPPAK